MLIPGIWRASGPDILGQTAQFHKSSPSLDETSRDQTLSRISGFLFGWRIQAIKFFGGFGLTADIAKFRDSGLHAIRGFVIADGSVDLRFPRTLGESIIEAVN